MFLVEKKSTLFEAMLIQVFTSHMAYGTFCVDLFVCVEVLRPSQPSGVMSSTVSLPNHTFTGQA